jgi:hypothetical protein
VEETRVLGKLERVAREEAEKKQKEMEEKLRRFEEESERRGKGI